MTPGSIRAIVLRALHEIIPENPTIYGVYRIVKEAYGSYDYATQLSDVRHAVNVFRTRDETQDWDSGSYLPRRLLAESDRVHQGNYLMQYAATWYDEDTGEETVSFGKMYSNSQLTPGEVLKALQEQYAMQGQYPGMKLIEIERISVWHRRGAPYAEGGYLAEL